MATEDYVFNYLNGILTEEEKNKFEEEMSKNTELLQEVLFASNFRFANKYDQLIKMDEIVQNIAHQYTSSPSQSISPKNNFITQIGKNWVIGSVVVVTLIAIIYLISTAKKPIIDKTKLEGIKLEINKELEISADVNLNNDSLSYFAQGFHLYNEKSIKAIAPLKEWLKQNPNDELAKLFIGISYVRKNEEDSSIAILIPIIEAQQKSTFPISSAKWIVALSYLKKGEIDSSYIILKHLKNSNDMWYGDKAQKYIDKIDNMKNTF